MYICVYIYIYTYIAPARPELARRLRAVLSGVEAAMIVRSPYLHGNTRLSHVPLGRRSSSQSLSRSPTHAHELRRLLCEHVGMRVMEGFGIDTERQRYRDARNLWCW